MLPKFNIAIVVFCGCMLFPVTLWSQHRDTFDEEQTSWELRESDATIARQSWIQERLKSENDSGRFENIRFRSSLGTRTLVSLPVPKAYVISELMPSVRIKANRPGVELMVRVVLPETPDEEDLTKPMTTLLKGPATTEADLWQRISFGGNDFDMKKLLDRHVWLLRKKYGSHVDARNAYIDLVVLNLYTGGGLSQVSIDELYMGGIVSADHVKTASEKAINDPAVQLAGFQQAVNRPSSHVRRTGTVIEVNKKPFFARIIQHNGEPFELLKGMGFNTIELQATATLQQLVEAKETDMWLVCPPPPSVGLTKITTEYDRVLCWSVGRNLSSRDLGSMRETIREIHESDIRTGRPVVANMVSGWSQASDVVDILNVGLKPLGTSFPLSQYSDWIADFTRVTNQSHPVWGDLQTEVTRGCAEQLSAMIGVAPPTPIEPQQMKMMAYEIIASGARGIRFRSRSRLDASDPGSHLRAITLQWLNRHLEQIEPWVAGGVIVKNRNRSQRNVSVTAIRTARSQLMLVQRLTGREQHYAGDLAPTTILLDSEGAAKTDRAYQLTDRGLVPLSEQRDYVSSQVSVNNCYYTAAVVLTQDPRVVSRLNESYQLPGQTFVQAKLELVQNWLAITQLINEQIVQYDISIPMVDGAMQEAVDALRKAESLINSASPDSGDRFVNLAQQRLAVARREILNMPLQQFKSNVPTPLLMNVSLVPQHWRVTQELTAETWKPNSLPAGDFENLQHMLDNGWENRRVQVQGLQTNVELSKSARVAGQYGLKMSVTGRSDADTIETTPLWIASGPVTVKPGNLVRIHGWVRIDRPIANGRSGLLITDTLGGPELAERIEATEGWQEFALYRAASRSSKVQVKFELTGVGEVLLDEITIRTIPLKPGPRQALR